MRYSRTLFCIILKKIHNSFCVIFTEFCSRKNINIDKDINSIHQTFTFRFLFQIIVV